jgi:hypothetical protein
VRGVWFTATIVFGIAFWGLLVLFLIVIAEGGLVAL